MLKDLTLVGYASGLAGVDIRCGDGPSVVQHSPYLKDNIWHMIKSDGEYPASAHTVYDLTLKLAHQVSDILKKRQRLCVLGGDHTSAIGTWSGVYDAMHTKGDLGLIWIDAHMDSHTPETTESGRLHGMPLAVLLGHGSDILTNLLHDAPKIHPQNLCLVGVRSFEKGEADLLKKNNVKVFLMDEVKARGLAAVMQEAVNHVTKKTIGFGISLDLDSIDPIEAPGVDVPEPGGLHALELIECLEALSQHEKLITTEIVEFDPSKDKNKLTENLILKLIRAIYARE